jgi:hypothetical protein
MKLKKKKVANLNIDTKLCGIKETHSFILNDRKLASTTK